MQGLPGNTKRRPAITHPEDSSVKFIALTRNKIAIVDADDYEYLNKWVWFALVTRNGISYAARKEKKQEGGQTTVLMHNQILKREVDLTVDHKNLDTLDNRKSNLRRCTVSQNAHNYSKSSANSSGFRGVYFNQQKGMWVSRIQVNGKSKYLGAYGTAEEASEVYITASKEIAGEFTWSLETDKTKGGSNDLYSNETTTRS